MSVFFYASSPIRKTPRSFGLHGFVSGLCIFLAATAGSAAGNPTYYEPARGSQERSAIMDAAREPIAREIGVPVIFVAQILRSDGQRAYLQATPINPDTTPLDWISTPFRDEWQSDMMSDIVMVLLKRQDEKWKVTDYVIGPTDVFWYGWVDEFGLPEALFYER